MSKAKVKADWKKSCVMRHILVLMDDTLRAVLIGLKGGGLVYGVQYPAAPLSGARADRVEKQVAEVKRWLDCCLHQEGIDAKNGGYRLSERERQLINRKIHRANRWALEQKPGPWREVVTGLASMNLAFFWARLQLGDNAHRRTAYLAADRLCLMLGDAEDWMLAADLFDFTAPYILDGLPRGGLKSEEEYFFRFLALPTPTTDMERALWEETGRKTDTAALLGVSA